ncbi:hypothetical protein COU74_05095 [Candidatus Peregrinibacteria bacterium CG10_big_fil_rev_8_21_14_0_10_36_19]|nr:MAG: hypothetical protein COU74_05095 [Candidatus Peregrinibacteria bacterium CG10_big_fil_rev_8_21_14_0_10_36_19]
MDNQSNLSPAAQQVFQVLTPVYGELRKEMQDILESLVKLSNTIIKKRAQNENCEEEVTEFNIKLNDIESNIFSEVTDDESEVILNNFFSKLRDLINE